MHFISAVFWLKAKAGEEAMNRRVTIISAHQTTNSNACVLPGVLSLRVHFPTKRGYIADETLADANLQNTQ